MKHVMWLMILLIPVLSFAQEDGRLNIKDEGFNKNEIKPLNIGDLIPKNIILQNVIKYSSPTLNLEAFRGKAIIFDFWNRNCSVCISEIEKMDSLQKQYADKMQIILVTNNSIEEIQYLLGKSTNLQRTQLPIVTSDTLLKKMFPHVGVPYLVWVNSAGVVSAKTIGRHFNKTNLESLFSGINLPFEIMKKDDLLDFSRSSPLIIEGNGRQWSHLEYYSMFMKSVTNAEKAAISTIKDPVTKKPMGDRGRTFFNASIPALYKYAYTTSSNPSFLKIIIIDENPGRYFLPKNKDSLDYWYENYSFSYEQLLPKEKINQRNALMQRDLESYFGFSGYFEKKSMEVYVLYKLPSFTNWDNLNTKYSIENIDPDNDSLTNILRFRGITTQNICNMISLYSSLQIDAPVVLNETNYDGLIDIHLTADLQDLPNLQKQLKRYELGLKREIRSIPCLVLKKNNFYNISLGK